MKFILIFFALSFTSCSGDSTDCSTDSDCFSEESCVSGECRPPSGGNNPNNQNNQNNANNQNNGNNQNNANNQNNLPFACVIDPFGNQCDDDDFEPNDSAENSSLPYEGNSWCDGTDPLDHIRSFSATFCANDDADSFRFAPRMWAPQCVEATVATVRITVEILTECDPNFIRIEPYDFFRNPTSNDLCDNDPNNDDVQCIEMDDGATRIFEFLEVVGDENQIWDDRIFIEADENIQFDYTVTVEIIG